MSVIGCQTNEFLGSRIKVIDR